MLDRRVSHRTGSHAMDWNQAIERNSTALKRIVTALFAMAGLGPDAPDAPATATLPRRVHTAVLGILGPAEAALRRLIVIAARDVVITLSPAERNRITRTARMIPAQVSKTGIFVKGRPAAPGSPGGTRRTAAGKTRLTAPSFALFDPLKRLSPSRPAPSRWEPRLVIDFDRGLPAVQPARKPVSPDDPVPAARLCRRLAALDLALADLPGQAKRLARWRARRRLRRGFRGRLSPLRPGPPPGHRKNGTHPVDDVLNRCHGLAVDAGMPSDTS